MKVAAVIPARMQSTRLPGKPLLLIAGVPMILRVLERARSCPELHRVIVATDSDEIRRVVEASGGEAWLTSHLHRTGSDRVAEVAEKLSEEVILNLQGDEPLLPPSTISALVKFASASPDFKMASAMVPLVHEHDIVNPNIVKVVVSAGGTALYFSRYPIPYRKDSPLDPAAGPGPGRFVAGYFKHVGIYIYRREFLLQYVRLAPTPLERSESLEQLRVIESGYPIHMVQVEHDSVSVDTPEDAALVESIIAGDWTA
jgi:3-deoxy-manno-octulosonate cytidylyltransferase (CMP-KDO synthetase)